MNQGRLWVLACSASKREDNEISAISSQVSLRLTTPLDLFADYRRCTRLYYPHAVKGGSPYAACLRYSGIFYQQIPLNLWLKSSAMPVLILSAYYGFLRLTDGIQNYNLSISQVKPTCRQMLPKLLKRYMDYYHLSEAVFLTSYNYFNCFENYPFAKRLHLYDGRNEVIGPYGRTYYKLAGRLFAWLLEGNELKPVFKGYRVEVK